MSDPEPLFEYRAPRWLVVTVAAAFLVFCAVTLGAILIPGSRAFALWVGAAGVLVGVLGLAEVLVGRVTLQADYIEVKQWFRTERVPLAEIADVSLEGGLTSLRLRTGAWKRLPEWLGANQSLGRRIRDRLKAPAPEG